MSGTNSEVLLFFFHARLHILVDINECRTNNGGCSQLCTNNDGSYECVCTSGYTLGANGRSCNGTAHTLVYSITCVLLCNIINMGSQGVHV